MGGLFFIFLLTPVLLIIGIIMVCIPANRKTGGILLLCSLVSFIIGFSLCSTQNYSYVPTNEELMEMEQMEEESNVASDSLNVDTIQ